MRIRKNIHIYGIVQGVGFRPFVSRLAERYSIGGSVCNRGSFVEISAEGDVSSVRAFEKALRDEAPDRSVILKMDSREAEAEGEREFRIRTSRKEKGNIFVSPDIATCPKCRAELLDPSDRRYRHPFINCTACGPRLTILDSMPYDRVRTSMGEFPMCPSCSREYTDPDSRRYHAQPICCNDCGPALYLLDRPETGMEALSITREIIRNGGIAAIKGIGGFHLCADASDPEAVARLRERKQRPFKPFAVMARNLDAAKRFCEISPEQEAYLDGPEKPILLLRKRTGGETAVCEAAAPENPMIGVMLPYAPVQILLFDDPEAEPLPDALIMTSGNPKGAPICRTDEDAREALAGIADVILSNSRKIRLRADDSVMNWFDGKPYMIRRSRGYAPLPQSVSGAESGMVLASGGELKNTFCLARDSLFYLSPYIGDMEDARSSAAWRAGADRLQTLLEIRPELVVADLHPEYHSSKEGERYARENGIPAVRIQHHYAHVLSCMAEHDCREPVIGVSFDGTGYGTDGTVWGGEFLLADPEGFRRKGHIEPFWQTGGNLAPRQGWRIAAAILMEQKSAEDAKRCISGLGICGSREADAIRAMAGNGINAVRSTSAGRLFDAASAILGYRRESTTEGEASMLLQFAAERYRKDHPGVSGTAMPLRIAEQEGIYELKTGALAALIADRALAGEDPGYLALEFHRTLADGICAMVRKTAEETGVRKAVLTGGVMQNLLLLELCGNGLKEAGITVLQHENVPANDGGIALGQAYYGMMNRKRILAREGSK